MTHGKDSMRIIDGNNLLHRIAESARGIHPVRFLYTRFVSLPETTLIVWDGPYANKRRQEIFPGYKQNRRPKEESQYRFFDIAKGVLRFTPAIQIECPGWEADDVIGTLVEKYHQGRNLIVETNDGDYWQHSEKCLLPLVSKKWHVFTAEECILYKSMVGDSKDGIPGLKGFGKLSWAYFNEEAKLKIIQAIHEDDFSLLLTVTCWPKRVKVTEELFEELKLYYKLNKYWEVPAKEIDDVLFAGKLNIDAAEIFMGKFMI